MCYNIIKDGLKDTYFWAKYTFAANLKKCGGRMELKMNKENSFGLEINDDVVIKMASVATLEVEGVAGLVSKTTDIKEVFSKNDYSRAIKVNRGNDTTSLDIYISVVNGSDVRKVAEEVQTNVKTKLQSMTGDALARVNVCVADVNFADAE